MKKIFFIFGSCLLLVKASLAQTYLPSPQNIQQRQMFQDRKFGLFIHWGIYSLLGDGEWVMFNKKIPYNDYRRLASFFNPQEFDAKAWVQLAKATGMKYITITSRHHDGFSIFKTTASPYNIVNATPYKKDPLAELSREAEKEDIALQLYYSLADWSRDDYGFGKKIVNGSPENTDWNSYINFMKTQLTELITNYPNIKAIWFDGNWERPSVNWHYNEIYSLIHQLNPAILIGNNHHMAPIDGEDFQMFEKDLPGENKTGYRKDNKTASLPLETCETMNNSWGFNINDRSYKSSKQLIQMLVNAAGRNANFLLNVGPMANGKIQPEFIDTLAVIGKWMQANGESIYGTRGNTVAPQYWGVVTLKDKNLFAHVLNAPKNNFIFIPGITQSIKSVTLFGTATTLKFKQQPEGVFIYPDEIKFDAIDTIFQLTMK